MSFPPPSPPPLAVVQLWEVYIYFLVLTYFLNKFERNLWLHAIIVQWFHLKGFVEASLDFRMLIL